MKKREDVGGNKESLLAAADNSGSGADKAEHGHKLTLTAKSNAMRRQL